MASQKKSDNVKEARPRALSSAIASTPGTDPGGGVRLDTLSISGSSPAQCTPPHVTQGAGKQDLATGAGQSNTTSPSFEVGAKPSGEVFGSPLKSARKPHRESTVQRILKDLNAPLEVARAIEGNIAAKPAVEGQIVGPAEHGLRYRTSNLSARHQVAGVDAQSVYSPEACVFVANLPEPKDDRALEAAVTREFSRFGTVYVKIRRDQHHMPFAFCQFTNVDHAKLAIEQGRGANILGRPCRTEKVKANCLFIVYKRSRDTITPEEARDLLEKHGKVKKAELLGKDLQELLRLPQTVLVEFTKFDAGRDLHVAYRRHDTYRVEAFDPKKSLAASRGDHDAVYLDRYDTVRRSIFVGGIHPSVTEEGLVELFREVGQVVKINFVKKPSVSSVPRDFAFLEFEHSDSPDAAVQAFHGMTFAGATLRVERKVAKDYLPTPRYTHHHQAAEFTSPTQAGPSHQPNTPSGSASLRAEHQAPASHHTPSMGPAWGSYSQPVPMNASPFYQGSPYYHGAAGVPMTPPASAYGYMPGFWPTPAGMPPYMADPAMAYYYSPVPIENYPGYPGYEMHSPAQNGQNGDVNGDEDQGEEREANN